MKDSFSGIERHLVGPYRRSFAWVTAPLVSLLTALQVSPNAVSAGQILLGIAVILVLDRLPPLAFMLFIGSLFLDSLDGALARRYGRSSEYGALFDQVCDYIRETLVLAAFALHTPLHPVAAVLYPCIYGMLNFLLFLCNYRGAPIPWAIKCYLVVYPAYFLYCFFGIDLLTPAVLLSIVFMSVSIVMGMRNLSKVMP